MEDEFLDFPSEYPIPPTKEWSLIPGDYLDAYRDHEGVRFWFGDPEQLLPADVWFEMRADMAAFIREHGRSGGHIVFAGKIGIWQAIRPELECESIMVPVDYPGGTTTIRVGSPVLMALQADVAELFKTPAPGITTNAFSGRIHINHQNRNWEGSIEVVW